MDDDTQVTGSQAPAQADTVADQTNEADIQVNEAPEATQGEQTEVKAEDTAEKLYAGKYKSVEDLENAYKNAESKLGQTTSEKAELARQLQGTFAEQEVAETQQLADSGYEVDPVAQKIERLERNDAVSRFIFSHPDADGVAVKEILTTDPNIAQIGSYDARLEYAYLKSKALSSSKAIAEAKKSGASETQAKIVEKQTAQVEASRKTETTDERTELKNRMAQGGSDGDAARREYIRKYLV